MTSPARMFAILADRPIDPPPQIGDLVLVEVPLNCSIVDGDARRLIRLRCIAAELARTVARDDQAAAPVPGAPEVVLTSRAARVLLAELLAIGADDAAANAEIDREDERKAANAAKLVRPTMESLSR